jgi:uncharacterized protein (DUF1778 family)
MHMTTNAQKTEYRRLVIQVPSDFHKRLKMAAAEREKDMRDIVIECVSACLEKPATPKPKE